MWGRRVEGEEVPEDAPEYTDATGGVKYDSPAPVGDDKARQRIRYPDAEAEACATRQTEHPGG